MRDTDVWDSRRYGILLLVVTAHLAAIAALLMSVRLPFVSQGARQPLELLTLPAISLPTVRAQSAAQQRFEPPLMVSLAPAMIQMPADQGPENHGTGVDWSAEARRALQAYDIRNRQPPSSRSVSGTPWEESWQHWGRYAAGERMKTPGGDWIIWISANCYRIASSGPTREAANASLAGTVCREEKSGVEP